MNNQSSFQLPNCFKVAIPYFEESDTLREFAIQRGDLIAAYCLRWKGISECIKIVQQVSAQDANFINTILDSLLNQLHDLKHLYNFTEDEGTTVLRQKIQSAFNVCIIYSATGTNFIPMECAYLYSQVVLYISTLESWSSIDENERNLMEFCKIEALKYVNMPVEKPKKSIRARLGFKETTEVPTSDRDSSADLLPSEPKDVNEPAVVSTVNANEPTDNAINLPSSAHVSTSSEPNDPTIISTDLSQPQSQPLPESTSTITGGLNSNLMVSLFPDQVQNRRAYDNNLPGDPLENIEEEEEPMDNSLQSTLASINRRLDDLVDADLGDMDDINVEAELGIPAVINTTNGPGPDVGVQALEEDSLDFSTMDKAKKEYWLNLLLTKANDIIDSIPYDQRSAEITEIGKILEKSLECASSIAYDYICLFKKTHILLIIS